MKNQKLIVVDTVTYPLSPRRVIQQLSFSVKRGECLAFMGANGTGKTTILQLLAGLIRPFKGRVLINGFDIHKEPKAKPYIGFLPDQLPLYNELTIREYLQFIAKLRRIPKQKREEAIEGTIAKLNLTSYEMQLIGMLSKGVKQRVGIAQAILHQPPILLLDEPTQGLDPKQIEAFQALLTDYKKAAAIVLSTHYRQEISDICDQTLFFNSEGIKAYDLQHCPA